LKNGSEEAFVREVLAGQPEPPAYFKHMKRINKQGPPILGGFREPPRLADEAIVAALERGDVIVDLRPTRELLEGAIPGVLGIPVGNSFPMWAGWFLPYDRPVTLLGERRRSRARRGAPARDDRVGRRGGLVRARRVRGVVERSRRARGHAGDRPHGGVRAREAR
jgi:hydroxyacylglutathione hydrolase